jgi:hypothetical protein
MILTPHAIVGAALANIFPSDPALGFGLAFISHYVLDMMPHTDYKIDNFVDKETKTVKSIFKSAGSALYLLSIAFDFLIAMFLCVLFFVRDEKSALITLVGIVGGLLPDFFQFLYLKYKNQPWIFLQKVHDKLHFEIKTKYLGILVQIFLPILILVVYFLIKK